MIHDNPMTAASPPIEAPPRAPHRRSPVTRIVLSLILIAAVVGTAMLVRVRSRAATSAAAAAASAAANRVVPVLTTKVGQRDVPVWLEGLGNVSAFYTVTVKPQVGGQIIDVLFKEGQHVKKGDVLVQIDPRPFAIALQSAQAALARDEANLKNAQLNLDRYKTLSDQKLIATQQYTDQAAAVAQARRRRRRPTRPQIESAKLNLDYARITSPIDGVTGVRLVDPGQHRPAARTRRGSWSSRSSIRSRSSSRCRRTICRRSPRAWPTGRSRSRRGAATATRCSARASSRSSTTRSTRRRRRSG